MATKRIYKYSKELYRKKGRYTQKTIQYSNIAMESGLSHEAVQEAAEELGIAVNAWWNLAALLALKNKQALKKMVKQKE